MMLIFWALFLGTSSPQKVLGTTEEMSGKKHSEDTVSMTSSLHSSPPGSPQGSPRKGKTGRTVQASSYFTKQYLVIYFVFRSVLITKYKGKRNFCFLLNFHVLD